MAHNQSIKSSFVRVICAWLKAHGSGAGRWGGRGRARAQAGPEPLAMGCETLIIDNRSINRCTLLILFFFKKVSLNMRQCPINKWCAVNNALEWTNIRMF